MDRMPEDAGDVDLVGRAAIVAEVRAALETSGTVVLTGPGGMGKSRVAAAVARSVTGARVIDLDPLGAGPAPVEALDAALSATSPLVVLDNAEAHAAAEAIVRHVLDASPSSRVLVTSRVPVRVRPAVVVPLGPLGTPAAGTPVEQSEAGTLFLMRAREAGGRFEGQGELEAAGALCRRLGGMPLAIELAAARTRFLPPSAILERLDDPRVLAGADRSRRQRSLDDVIGWSLGLLDAERTYVLRAAALLPGSFDVALLEVAAPDADVLNALEELTAVGLVHGVPSNAGAPRFRVLEPVRARLAALPREPELDGVDDRALDAIARRIEAAAADVTRGMLPAALARYEAERAYVAHAVHALRAANPDRALSLAAASATILRAAGRLREARALLEAALDGGGSATPRAIALGGLAQVTAELDGAVRAAPLTREAADAAEAAGQLRLATDLQLDLAIGALSGNDLDAAETAARRARDLAARQGDEGAMTQALMTLAVVAGDRGDHATSARLFTEAGERARRTGDQIAEARALANLGVMQLHNGRPRAAVAPLRAACDGFAAVGAEELLTWSRSVLALALGKIGDPEAGAVALDACRRAREADSAEAIAIALETAIPALVRRGAAEVAAFGWGAAEALRETSTDPLSALERAMLAGELRSGRPDEVRMELARRDGAARGAVAALDRVIAELEGGRPGTRPATAAHPGLTPREVEVLRLLADGRSDGDIARALFISPKTASVHVANAKSKLGASSRLELALWAREMGLGR